MSSTTIEWTQQTWNPVAGCSIVSPGCKNCYAMRMAARLEAMGQAKYAGLTKKVNGHHVWTGKITLDDEALAIPLKRKKPTTWFVNSMSDLFHEGVPFEFVDRVFAVMALTPQHTYQILTKRPERMAQYLARDESEGRFWIERKAIEIGVEHGSPRAAYELRSRADGFGVYRVVKNWPLPNVWLGTSCEDQPRADERIPHLLNCEAAVRFLSCEPLLGLIDLSRWAGTYTCYTCVFRVAAASSMRCCRGVIPSVVGVTDRRGCRGGDEGEWRGRTRAWVGFGIFDGCFVSRIAAVISSMAIDQAKGGLSPRQARIFDIVVGVYPESITREAIAEQMQIHPRGGSFGEDIGRLAGRGLVESSRGVVRARDFLFASL